MSEPITPERLRALAAEIHFKNRTIVSKDIPGLLDAIERVLGDRFIRHRYPTGADHGTWVVPPRWDVRQAWLKGPDGRIVADYAEHPLFVAPYSHAFHGKLTLEALKPHVRLHPRRDDAFYYEHRLAYDYRRRLNDWLLTMPRERFEALPEGEYEVELDVEVEPGEMLVAEYILPGETDECIALLSDYCHPGQCNDSMSGILAMLKVIETLRAMPRRRYTYRWYVFPETIGSCVLIAEDPTLLEGLKLAIYSEMVAWGGDFAITYRVPKPDAISAHLAREAVAHFPGTRLLDMFASWGNDEHIFEYAGVPSLSVQRLEVPEYHSSRDHYDLISDASLAEAAERIHRLCRVMERDAVYDRVHPVPIYMTRVGMYVDAVFDHANHVTQREVLYALDGRRTLLEIATAIGADFEVVADVVERLHGLGLLRRIDEEPK
jgi:aminopeptidase-like protein